MKSLICLAIFVILSTFCAILMIIAGFLCQYKKNDPVKETTYECGIKPTSDTKIRFDIKYFNYAILFLVFDVETIFLYPFAISINEFGIFIIIETAIFIALLLLGLFYAIQKNMLRWI